MARSRISKVTDEEWEECNKINKRLAKEFLRQAQLSPETLKQYESAVKIFFRWVKDEWDNIPIFEMKARHGIDYQNYLDEQGLSPKGIRFKRSVVSSMCGYAEVFMADDYPKFKNIYNKQVPNVTNSPKREKIPLTLKEYTYLCDELEKQEKWQMLAFLKFTFYSGCRKSEAHQLMKEVVNYDYYSDQLGNKKEYYRTKTIRAKGKGKEGNPVKLIFDDDVKYYLNKWLEVRGEDDCPYMFVSKNKKGEVKHINKNTFNYWLSSVFSKIVGREVWVHLLRSSRATSLSIEEGKDIEAIRALLNHKDSSTTKIYVVKEDDDDLDGIF